MITSMLLVSLSALTPAAADVNCSRDRLEVLEEGIRAQVARQGGSFLNIRPSEIAEDVSKIMGESPSKLDCEDIAKFGADAIQIWEMKSTIRASRQTQAGVDFRRKFAVIKVELEDKSPKPLEAKLGNESVMIYRNGSLFVDPGLVQLALYSESRIVCELRERLEASDTAQLRCPTEFSDKSKQ